MIRPDILITSFERRFSVRAPLFSAAVYQPKGLNYPKAEWADIRDQNGKWIRPREFVGPDEDPLLLYHHALLNLYAQRREQIDGWLTRLADERWPLVALMCWCPYERRAQEQLCEHGSFVCHTAVVGEVLEANHSVRVWYDSDRRRMKVLP